MSTNREMMLQDEAIKQALDAAGIDYNATGYDPEKTFRDNGIDSLDVMSLFLEIEEKHGVNFTEEEALAVKTPGDLLSALAEKLKNV
jgi:acyl carrier protein